MMNHELMIEAHDLRRTFGSKEAVAGISFSTGRGEIFGLLGPNGAGKTTTIRMLTGQIDPSGGNAVVAGCDIVKERAQLKQRIGVVFEEQNLYERLSARLNLEFSCWLYGLPKSRVDEVLDLVKLRDRAKDSIRTFSNGMKQRMMIARALLHRPPMLFLDEPSRGLADQLCQHVAFIVNGRLVANDTPRNLKLAHGQRALSVTLEEVLNVQNGNGTFNEKTLSLDDPADQQRLVQWMTQGRVRAVHSREATLEEVFIEIAGVRPA